jgi:hypothetical protein
MQLIVMNGYSSKWLLFILSVNEVNESIELVIRIFVSSIAGYFFIEHQQE